MNAGRSTILDELQHVVIESVGGLVSVLVVELEEPVDQPQDDRELMATAVVELTNRAGGGFA